MVLIPPILGSAFQYRQIAPLLVAAGFRVLAIELPGVARGSRPRVADYSLTAQADRVAAVLDSLAIDTVPGVGHFPHEESPAAVVEALVRLRSAGSCMAGLSGSEAVATCLRRKN